ncbi:hypothetical protein F4553_001891 [Allocatelliglobosispora scoriae]|uniref:Uncharacterized protein n=1 Tax=Allocatelliglobosispora scoriae TaxID=643052 RepID=A0A841BP45_9ACTN|nr:hypothetical protein [Allocatelliglobosispora scoriae]MBB5868512.1 hypothetical protein [Allocatelliglobosispora scoriae]
MARRGTAYCRILDGDSGVTVELASVLAAFDRMGLPDTAGLRALRRYLTSRLEAEPEPRLLAWW